MRAGRLRHLVTFQSLGSTQDAAGQMVPSWVAAFPVPLSAEITALSGRELIAAQAEQSEVTTRLKVRYRPGFVADMRGVHRGTVYNIKAVIPDPESGFQWVTLMCSSGLNAG